MTAHTPSPWNIIPEPEPYAPVEIRNGFLTEADGVCVGEHVGDTIVAELAKRYKDAKETIERMDKERETCCRKL